MAKVKVWRVHSEAGAHIRMEESAAFIASGKKNFLAVDQNGLSLRGNLSFISMGEGQRTGGLFIYMNEFIRQIPTTILTPFPPLLPIPPLGFVKNITGSVTTMLSFVALV